MCWWGLGIYSNSAFLNLPYLKEDGTDIIEKKNKAWRWDTDGSVAGLLMDTRMNVDKLEE